MFETTNVCTIIYKLNNIVLRIDKKKKKKNHFKKMASHVEGLVVPILCPKTIPKGNVEDFFFFFWLQCGRGV